MPDDDRTRRDRSGQDSLGDIAPNEMHALALSYWKRGFSVVPQRPGAKSPAVRWKRYQDMLPTRGCIDAWWLEDFRDAGIAVILGPRSGLFAIDVDGAEPHRVLVERLGELPIAPQVQSGSGDANRFHLFFRYPVGVRTKAKATPWHDHLEFRGHRGIIVLPPSLHKSGNRYRWLPGRSLDDLELPELPEPVLEALKDAQQQRVHHSETLQTPKPESRRQRALNFVGICHETQRFLDGHFSGGPCWNDRLFRAACDLQACGVPLDQAQPALLDGAAPWSPEDRADAIATILSAYSEDRLPARQLAAANCAHAIDRKPVVEFVVGSIRVTAQFECATERPATGGGK